MEHKGGSACPLAWLMTLKIIQLTLKLFPFQISAWEMSNHFYVESSRQAETQELRVHLYLCFEAALFSPHNSLIRVCYKAGSVYMWPFGLVRLLIVMVWQSAVMSLIAALITVSGPGCVNYTIYLSVSELEDGIELLVVVLAFFRIGSWL